MCVKELKILRKLQNQFKELSSIINGYEEMARQEPDRFSYKLQLVSLYNHREDMEERISQAKNGVRKSFSRVKRSVVIKQISKRSKFYQYRTGG